MSLDFAAKQHVITHFSDPANWQNKFDPDFFDDKTRRWRSVSYGNVNLSYDRDDENRKEFIISHSNSNASLHIQQQDLGFLITDERGVTVSSSTPYSERQQHSVNGGETDNFTASATVEHLGVRIEFSDQGQKRITFADSNTYIELEGSDEPAPSPLKTGRFFHAINFDEDFLGRLAASRKHPLSFVTVIAAMDMGLEPSIRTFNGFVDAVDAAAKIQNAKSYRQAETAIQNGTWNIASSQNPWKGLVASLEKAWRDSAEFDGYKVATPKSFSIMAEEVGFSIQTTSTGKERILSRGCLFAAAVNNEPPTHALSRNIMNRIFPALAEADPVKDRGNQPWHVIVINHDGHFDAIRNLAGTVEETHLLDTDQFAVMTFSPTQSFVAIRQDALDQCLSAPKAKSVPQSGRQAPNVVQLKFNS
ncbi:MAG TPA: hypothetical protein PLF01_08090 [Alphaproteobacteria bacterium]|nr:hypothetical protein [Alphaproteobacteria bacterium]